MRVINFLLLTLAMLVVVVGVKHLKEVYRQPNAVEKQ